MKLKLMCNQCLLDHTPKGGGLVHIPFDPNCILELDDRDYYEFTCQNGHENCYFLSMPKYTILYDMGFCAYQNGFYREAVLDFAASYERFNEYAIYIMLWGENASLNQDIARVWKVMARQSERQLGAFVSLFFKTTGTLPSLIDDKHVQFRNEITHKGAFPSKEETYDYARCIADYIKSNVNKISDQFGFDHRGLYPQIKTILEQKKPCQGHLFPTLITQYSCGNTFEDSIKGFNAHFNNNYCF